MKVKLFFTLFVLSLSVSIAMAKSDPQLVKFITQNCQFSNMNISDDDKMDCATDIINCAIVGSGETDLTKVTLSCLNKKSRERIYEQRIQNPSRSRSSIR